MYAPVGSGANDQAIGQTPTREAFAVANALIQATAFSGPATVLLITDGAPNCNWDQTATTDIVAGWLATFHIKTYVLGLGVTATGGTGGTGGTGTGGTGGTGTIDGPSVLDAIASAGGTGQYLDLTDRMTIEKMLGDSVSSPLVSTLDSCSITIDPPAARPSDLELIVTERATNKVESAPHDLGNGGWTISSDGAHVKLTGSLCDDARTGRFTSIDFEYTCKKLPKEQVGPPPCWNPGESACGSTCVDTATDEKHCGACDHACAAGATCCAGQCVDSSSDKNNCGACGVSCTGLCCDGTCKDSDVNNCGTCGHVCPVIAGSGGTGGGGGSGGSGGSACCCNGMCYAPALGGGCC
jgi:hypothetical protein